MLKNKTILGLVTILIISGCGFGGNGDSEINLNVFENSEFSFNHPTEWEIITPGNFTEEIPLQTEIVVRNNIKNDLFTANFSVVKIDLNENKNSKDFASEIINNQKQDLTNFNLQTEEETSIQIGENQDTTNFVVFQGKLENNNPTVRFSQIYATKNKSGYIATCGTSEEIQDDVPRICDAMVKSFQLK